MPDAHAYSNPDAHPDANADPNAAIRHNHTATKPFARSIRQHLNALECWCGRQRFNRWFHRDWDVTKESANPRSWILASQEFAAGPLLKLHGSTGEPIAQNDDWGNSPDKQAIIDTGISPSNPFESAILMTLNPGLYTAVLRDADGQTGIGLVEVYDPDLMTDSQLAKISTRGFVETNDNVMIGGLIVLGTESAHTIPSDRAVLASD